MHFSPFSPENLKSCLRAGDSGKFKVNLLEDRDTICDAASEAAKAKSLSFEYDTIELDNGRKIYALTSFHTVLCIRALSKAIKTQFKLHPPNRNYVVRSLIQSLTDAPPCFIARGDISSFYESINLDTVLKEIRNSTRTHPDINHMFELLIKNGIIQEGAPGVPRGIGLSTVLAELSLRSFDKQVSNLPDVYRYYRYADDFIVFATSKHSISKSKISDLLPDGMSLNTEKSNDNIKLTFSTPAKETHPDPTVFEYLGYRFTAENCIETRAARTVTVTLSNNKIKKRKTRAILALRDFQRTRDVGLLINRIRYLTSNFDIKKHGQTHGRKYKKVRTGIFYNYPACGIYRKGQRSDTCTEIRELKSLDGFLQNLFWSKNSEWSDVVKASLSDAQKRNLRQLSFNKGFSQKRLVRFTRKQVSEIGKAWKHA